MKTYYFLTLYRIVQHSDQGGRWADYEKVFELRSEDKNKIKELAEEMANVLEHNYQIRLKSNHNLEKKDKRKLVNMMDSQTKELSPDEY